MDTLPALPLEQWRPTKDTLHLWAQIVGKVRLAHMPARNHWWHAPLYVGVRGLTTGRIPVGGSSLQIDLDLVDHRLVVTTPGAGGGFALQDGVSVAEFYGRVMQELDALGMATAIKPTPYGVPMTTPFPEDTGHASYDREAVARFHQVLTFADTVLQEFAGWFSGKSSPVHVFWHSFDLAHTRFSGRAAPVADDVDPVTAEAYSEEVISFGFWAGDDVTPAPTFYAYAAPEPEGLADQPLRPDAATWFVQPSGATAHLPYDAVRQAQDPRAAVLDFFQSAYEAGGGPGKWDLAQLATSWAPAEPVRRGGPMADPHLDQIGDVTPAGDGCASCIAAGDRWVHLRLCMTCGHVGCCDNSKNRHATGHFHSTQHPIIQSYEPGEDWWWCFIDEAGFFVDDAPSYAHR